MLMKWIYAESGERVSTAHPFPCSPRQLAATESREEHHRYVKFRE